MLALVSTTEMVVTCEDERPSTADAPPSFDFWPPPPPHPGKSAPRTSANGIAYRETKTFASMSWLCIFVTDVAQPRTDRTVPPTPGCSPHSTTVGHMQVSRNPVTADHCKRSLRRVRGVHVIDRRDARRPLETARVTSP